MRNVTLKINGIQHTVSVEPDKVLLDLLREDFDLTGTKQSCDRKGQCGACTVIVNGKTALSCLTKVVDIQGAEVITVEGLGTPDNPHLIQEAYVLSGAIQCGFCTPGMIMATKALLDKNPDPSKDDIKRALARNLCRCTGYVKIFDAVNLAARFLRKETTPEEVRRDLKPSTVGVSHPRPTALLKACGLAKFTGDIKPGNAVELAVVRSTEFHAVIKEIDTKAAEKLPGVVGFMKADDIKGTNRIRSSAPDQPVLCEDVVRTIGDPIIAVAAETKAQALAAAAAVKVTYEPLPVLMTPEEAMAPGAVTIHKSTPDNVLYTRSQIKGDAAKALSEAEAIVEGEFTTQINHQAPLEPECCVSYLENDDKVVVIGRSINIHLHAAQVKEAVGCSIVRYKEAFVGGQFGIKASITTEALTAAAAMHFKRPVRYTPSLHESIVSSNKRHSYRTKIKLGADADGHISVLDIDMLVNKGAYALQGLMVISRSLLMLNGAYNIPNIIALGKIVYSNAFAGGGAARGAGPPQSVFALESAVDMLADNLGVDALEFRKKNSLQPGQSKSCGMVVKQWSFPAVCDAIKPHWERAKKDTAAFNAKGGPVRRGVGIAAMSFGIGGAADSAKLSVEMNPDDSITIYAAVADPGEGNDSMLSQIAAHVMDMPISKINLYTRDTEKTVGMGPAAGSRMTLMAGNALINALEQLKKSMEEAKTSTYDGLKQAGKPIRYEGTTKNPGDITVDPKTGQGSGYITEDHNIQMVELEVNTETGAVKILKITSVLDPGTVIHPQNVEGQVEGGMDQGVGFALREEYIPGKTKDWISFKFPTIKNSFEMEVHTVQTPREGAPLGSTGVGEMTMVSTAPAVTNAIYNACGIRIHNLPATPDKIKAALAKKS